MPASGRAAAAKVRGRVAVVVRAHRIRLLHRATSRRCQGSEQRRGPYSIRQPDLRAVDLASSPLACCEVPEGSRSSSLQRKRGDWLRRADQHQDTLKASQQGSCLLAHVAVACTPSHTPPAHAAALAYSPRPPALLRVIPAPVTIPAAARRATARFRSCRRSGPAESSCSDFAGPPRRWARVGVTRLGLVAGADAHRRRLHRTRSPCWQLIWWPLGRSGPK